MRGGVTRKKLLTRRKVADLTREIGLGHGGSLNTRIKEFVRPALTNRSIRYAEQDGEGSGFVGQKGHMVMTHFYQKNVFESCLKISARLRAEILQIRVKTGHFGVKMDITILSS